MTPHSRDLRQPIVHTVLRCDGTLSQIAERSLVSDLFVARLLQLHRTAGSVEPRPHGRRQPGVAHTRGTRAAPRAHPGPARCHARGVSLAPRVLAQSRYHLSGPEPAGLAAQQEDPARRASDSRDSPSSARPICPKVRVIGLQPEFANSHLFR